MASSCATTTTAATPHFFGRHRRGVAKTVLQRPKTVGPLAALGLGLVMGVYKGAQAFQHFGGGWHLFHGLLRIEPAAGVVVVS